MGQLKLKDLYIGKTDGYNEFLEYGSDVCRNLFFEYPNLDMFCCDLPISVRRKNL